MSQADTQVAVHPDALELAALLRPSWPVLSEELRRKSALVCEETEEERKKREAEEAEAEEERKKAEAEKSKTPPWGSDDEFKPERAWKLIQDLRGDNAKLKASNDELSAKVKKHEDASKSDQEKLTEAKTESDRKAAEAVNEAARLRVALDKGLTATQAKRLVGNSEEELATDADELLESFKSDEADGQEPRRRPKERLRPGAAPGSEPEETDPRKLAEAVPRRW